MCVETHISDCVRTVHALLLLPNDTPVKHSYTNREWCELLMGIYHSGAGLAVTWRIGDIGQNGLQPSFQTRVCSSPHLMSNFLLQHFPRGDIH